MSFRQCFFEWYERTHACQHPPTICIHNTNTYTWCCVCEYIISASGRCGNHHDSLHCEVRKIRDEESTYRGSRKVRSRVKEVTVSSCYCQQTSFSAAHNSPETSLFLPRPSWQSPWALSSLHSLPAVGRGGRGEEGRKVSWCRREMFWRGCWHCDTFIALQPYSRSVQWWLWEVFLSNPFVRLKKNLMKVVFW